MTDFWFTALMASVVLAILVGAGAGIWWSERRDKARRAEAERLDKLARGAPKQPLKFTGHAIKCPYCSHSKVRAEFCEGPRRGFMTPDTLCYRYNLVDEPHLHRVCGECGFTWFECGANDPRNKEDDGLVEDLFRQSVAKANSMKAAVTAPTYVCYPCWTGKCQLCKGEDCACGKCIDARSEVTS